LRGFLRHDLSSDALFAPTLYSLVLKESLWLSSDFSDLLFVPDGKFTVVKFFRNIFSKNKFREIFSEKNEKFLHFLLDGICEIEIMMVMAFSASFTKNQRINGSTDQRINGSTDRKNVKRKKKKSFTLVEVVFTISIIGILLAILMPAMSAIKLSAQKIQDVSHLKKIAEAWREYTIERGNTMNLRAISQGTDYADYGNWFARSLAGIMQDSNRFYPSKCVLNDSCVYISSGDKYASKAFREYIVRGKDNSEGCEVREDIPWSTAATADLKSVPHQSQTILSYCTIGNLDGSVPLATTPLAFTRGLKADGTWDGKYGLYGTEGGYVVFCDGHTTWFDGSRPAKFLHRNQQEYTTDIRKAVPNVARIGNGGVIGTVGNEYGNLIVQGNGTGG
jgi:competence protein ComGC